MSESEEQELEQSPEQEPTKQSGHMTREEWEAKGRDPDDWVSERQWKERGEMIERIKSLERKTHVQEDDFSRRLENVNKMHEVQTKAMITELEAKKKNHIELGEFEQSQQIQTNIDELKSAPKVQPTTQPSAHPDQQIIDDFNRNNPWIMDDSNPKTPYAQSRFSTYQAQGMNTTDAINKMMEDINRSFQNPRRSEANTVESNPKSKPSTKKNESLVWENLTHEEKKFYDPNIWPDKKEYLQVVKDVRSKES